MRVKKAVFPVAGAQIAFLPATKGISKDLLPIVDTPLVQYAVEEAIAAGIEEFIFIERPGDTLIRRHFEPDPELEDRLERRFGPKVADAVRAVALPEGSTHYIEQGETRGLGHAIACARDLIGDAPFAVILPDDMIISDTPVMKQMVDRYENHDGAMIAGIEVIRSAVARYGIMRIEDTGGAVVSVKGLVEKPDSDRMGSNFAVVGRYILPPEIFPAIEATPPDSQGAVQLTDAIARLLGQTPTWGVRFEGERFDCGSPQGVVRATIATALRRPDLSRETMNYIRRVLDREESRLRRLERGVAR